MTLFNCRHEGASMHAGCARLYRLALPLFLALLGISCGETYRPVAQPIIGASPSPAPVHYMFSIALDGAANPGSMSRIDVSGDTVSSVIATGVAPAYAALTPDGTKLYIANSGENTVSQTSTSATAQAATIDLQQLCGTCSSTPVFVHSTENSKMYVANFGDGTVSVINTNSNVVIATVAVDPAFSASPLPLPNPNAKPVALAELPNATKIYSVNQGNNTVTSINVVDDSIASVIPFTSSPVWAVASSDSAYIYVLDVSGKISVIAAVSDTVVSSVSVGAGANYIFYDKAFNRLFVTNPALGTLNVFIVSGNTLTPHGSGTLQITAAPSSSCTSAPAPASVTVLGDGSRAYVASLQADANGNVCTQVSVIDVISSASIASTIELGQATASAQTRCSSARFRVFAASSGGGTNSNFKVYVSQCDAGSVAVIDTYAVSSGPDPHPADVVMSTVNAPVSSFAGDPQPSQNPVLLVAGP